ncbi:MAG: hypothetical protein HGA76_11180, partial [Candidatus Firestonebacteria bacterium]|nr:hypothetical protein [Candidatus Firestonebacteria bacterium]
MNGIREILNLGRAAEVVQGQDGNFEYILQKSGETLDLPLLAKMQKMGEANGGIFKLIFSYDKDKGKSDGYKIIFKNKSWVCVRVSGTEPVVRVYGERVEPCTMDNWYAVRVASFKPLNDMVVEVQKLLGIQQPVDLKTPFYAETGSADQQKDGSGQVLLTITPAVLLLMGTPWFVPVTALFVALMAWGTRNKSRSDSETENKRYGLMHFFNNVFFYPWADGRFFKDFGSMLSNAALAVLRPFALPATFLNAVTTAVAAGYQKVNNGIFSFSHLLFGLGYGTRGLSQEVATAKILLAGLSSKELPNLRLGYNFAHNPGKYLPEVFTAFQERGYISGEPTLDIKNLNRFQISEFQQALKEVLAGGIEQQQVDSINGFFEAAGFTVARTAAPKLSNMLNLYSVSPLLLFGQYGLLIALMVALGYSIWQSIQRGAKNGNLTSTLSELTRKESEAGEDYLGEYPLWQVLRNHKVFLQRDLGYFLKHVKVMTGEGFGVAYNTKSQETVETWNLTPEAMDTVVTIPAFFFDAFFKPLSSLSTGQRLYVRLMRPVLTPFLNTALNHYQKEIIADAAQFSDPLDEIDTLDAFDQTTQYKSANGLRRSGKSLNEFFKFAPNRSIGVPRTQLWTLVESFRQALNPEGASLWSVVKPQYQMLLAAGETPSEELLVNALNATDTANIQDAVLRKVVEGLKADLAAARKDRDPKRLEVENQFAADLILRSQLEQLKTPHERISSEGPKQEANPILFL